MKLRRGVDLEQTRDDIERKLGKADIVNEFTNIEIGQVLIVEGGTLYWRDKTGTYYVTGTELG